MKHLIAALSLCGAASAWAQVPAEPVEIGHETQFLVDDYLVDNRWSLKPKHEELVRAFHAPVRHEANPVIPANAGYVTVVKDADTGGLKMWWQTHHSVGSGGDEGNEYAVAYAESDDGVAWRQPRLGLLEWKGGRDNNIVWKGPTEARASGPQIVQVPEKDRRGHKYIMTYRTAGAREKSGIRIVGSADGIHWDKSSDSLLVMLGSDTLNSLVYDSRRAEYVMTCRAKDRYLVTREDPTQAGESRRIARLSHAELWNPWPAEQRPQSILIPDELDMEHGFNRFYGMSSRYHAGIHWGLAWGFKLNTDIHTELCWSRDSFRFERLPSRPRLIDLGPPGAWDDGMVFGSADWVEMGDEWWLYYAGHDGPHEERGRKSGIGIVRMRKEGFISLHGPAGGGVVVTRLLKWPGGDLVINADAKQGEIKVRVSDARRQPLPGFGPDDMEPFTGDAVNQTVRWKADDMRSLAGKKVRLEFVMKNCDLYTFRASPP